MECVNNQSVAHEREKCGFLAEVFTMLHANMRALFFVVLTIDSTRKLFGRERCYNNDGIPIYGV